ncbi:MAG TPA: transglutaminase-like domain-containing protein [Smithellaceae bacterium]|nr:transglutaminase-like domain-containing protein [Smithellaceae bacterium]
MKKISGSLFFLVILFISNSVLAENFNLKGDMDSTIRYELQHQIIAGDSMKKLVLSFVVPQSFTSPIYKQQISNFNISFSPEAQERKNLTDERGNNTIVATWNRVPGKIDATVTFDAKNVIGLKLIETTAGFPLTGVPYAMADYLKATEQVQADNPEIRRLALRLTNGVKTQFDAVQRIVSWVVDHVRYVNPPVQYDALYSFHSGKGNCQNYSHLSAALLRSVGIPVRIVNGVTLNQPFSINWEKGILTFKMGQGRHSWIEVWFPDQGWMPYDPQNMQLFVSNRFVRIEVGVDNNETKNDGLLQWIQSADARVKPQLQETIGANFLSDSAKVSGSRQAYGPKNLLLGPNVRAEFKKITMEPPPQPIIITEEEKKDFRFTVPFVYGNLDFPVNIDFAFPRSTKSSGKNSYQMSRNFLVETAEYVTTKATQYAQIVVLKKPVKLQKVALALHKFGGEGMLWIDIFQDNQGKPGETLYTSEMLSLDQLSMKPGYRWVNFRFSKDSPVLMPGSYWIALGFSGSPVINWFYTYGKPVGPVYGTRYKGVFEEDWSGALNYEFNYRVTGLTTK